MHTATKLSTLALLGLLTATANAGTLYATRNGTTFHQVDTSNAQLTSVGTYGAGADGEAIAYHPDSGNLYRWTGNFTRTWSTIDPSLSALDRGLLIDGTQIGKSFCSPSSDHADEGDDPWDHCEDEECAAADLD